MPKGRKLTGTVEVEETFVGGKEHGGKTSTKTISCYKYNIESGSRFLGVKENFQTILYTKSRLCVKPHWGKILGKSRLLEVSYKINLLKSSSLQSSSIRSRT